jgi:NAD(P)-dependent dehydrogenase (short-subunit alcohol dehydrogenase family)
MLVAAVYTSIAHLWVYGTQRTFNIVKELPANDEKTIAIVTGSNTGIGFEVAKTLVVDYGWEVILACRSREKAIKAMNEINQESGNGVGGVGGVAVVLDRPLDLSDLASIQKYSQDLKEQYQNKTIGVLINNAGRNTSGKAEGGLDLLFTSNFLGHFVLTNLLIDKLRGGRVINLSSVMHHFAGTQQPKDEQYWKSVMMYQEPPLPHVYSASKLAAILFTIELNRRFSGSHGIRSIAVNPGGVASDIWRDFPPFMQDIFRKIYLTPKQGASTTVAAAVGKGWRDDEYYLQPFWLSESTSKAVPPAYVEMHGPYVGYFASKPRLPDIDGVNAANSLWNAANEIIESVLTEK